MSWANEKLVCVCGGKYTNKNKSTHIKTKKHLEFLENKKEKEKENHFETISKEEVEDLIEYEMEKLTITVDDPEWLIKDCKSVKQQQKIIDKLGPGSSKIPSHLKGRDRSKYIHRCFDLWQELKVSKYEYTPPNRDAVRKRVLDELKEEGLIMDE